MSCDKPREFKHGDQVERDGLVGTVLGVMCDGTVMVMIGGQLKSCHPSTLTIVGYKDTEEAEIECMFCHKVRRIFFDIFRFWIPPIAVGAAFAGVGFLILGVI